jgi:hypothetical protein
MGTNYYLHKNVCPHCGKPEDVKHIGKSSAGWCFSLHAYPEDGINDLNDWMARFGDGEIKDEYGDTQSPEDMLAVITERGYGQRGPLVSMSSAEMARNHAEPGPNGLLRHRIEFGHCIGHGAGTWDLIVGEFS